MTVFMKNWISKRSLHTSLTACVATLHTLPMNQTKLQNQRVGCVRYARTRLFDWRFAVSTFNFVEASSFRRPPMSSETSASTKLNLKKQTIPSPTSKPQTKILWRVIAETSLPAAHSFSLSNSPIQNRACLLNISTYCVRLIWMCKNNIPLKPSPYAYCRTIFTPFGRCLPTMRIIPCAGGWLKPNSPHISLMPKICLPANSGGTNAVFGNGVFMNTPCATKRTCNVARTTSISIPSNMDYVTMSAIGRFRRFTVMCEMDGCH